LANPKTNSFVQSLSILKICGFNALPRMKSAVFEQNFEQRFPIAENSQVSPSI
jgi:hypothetical protein